MAPTVDTNTAGSSSGGRVSNEVVSEYTSGSGTAGSNDASRTKSREVETAGAAAAAAAVEIQAAITDRLRVILGEEGVEILTEYVWHMLLSSKRNRSHIIQELQEFLAEETEGFVKWLLTHMVPLIDCRVLRAVPASSAGAAGSSSAAAGMKGSHKREFTHSKNTEPGFEAAPKGSLPGAGPPPSSSRDRYPPPQQWSSCDQQGFVQPLQQQPHASLFAPCTTASSLAAAPSVPRQARHSLEVPAVPSASSSPPFRSLPLGDGSAASSTLSGLSTSGRQRAVDVPSNVAHSARPGHGSRGERSSRERHIRMLEAAAAEAACSTAEDARSNRGAHNFGRQGGSKRLSGVGGNSSAAWVSSGPEISPYTTTTTTTTINNSGFRGTDCADAFDGGGAGKSQNHVDNAGSIKDAPLKQAPHAGGAAVHLSATALPPYHHLHAAESGITGGTALQQQQQHSYCVQGVTSSTAAPTQQPQFPVAGPSSHFSAPLTSGLVSVAPHQRPSPQPFQSYHQHPYRQTVLWRRSRSRSRSMEGGRHDFNGSDISMNGDAPAPAVVPASTVPLSTGGGPPSDPSAANSFSGSNSSFSNHSFSQSNPYGPVMINGVTIDSHTGAGDLPKRNVILRPNPTSMVRQQDPVMSDEKMGSDAGGMAMILPGSGIPSSNSANTGGSISRAAALGLVELLTNPSGALEVLQEVAAVVQDVAGVPAMAPATTNKLRSHQTKKLMKRCSEWPECQYGDHCRYIHPVQMCANWPRCSFGNACFYIHPEVACKFGLNCHNHVCNYTHPKGWNPSDNSAVQTFHSTFFVNKTLRLAQQPTALDKSHEDGTNSMPPGEVQGDDDTNMSSAP